MGKFKKGVSIFLAIILALGVCVPVFGAEQTGTLTIHNTKLGETYTLYRVFDLTYAADVDSYAYTIHSDFLDFFTDEKIEEFQGDTKDLKAIAYVESREQDLADFATELQQYIISAGIDSVKVVNGQAGQTHVEDLLYGYYLMVPSDMLSVDGLSALFSLDTMKPNAQINNKSQYPTIEKHILENGKEVDSNTVSMGDVVQYQVTSFVPSLAGYSSYVFYITDVFSAGLTFSDDVTISLIQGEQTKALKKNEDFTVAQEGQVVTITFTNFIQYKSTGWQGASIVVTYSALVNDDAAVGNMGNTNTASLTYSHNPGDATETKTTTPEAVNSYIAGVIIHKVDVNGNALTGAQFQLGGDNINRVKVQGTELQAKTNTTDVHAFVDENGKLILEGIAEGTYQIKELIAPAGYHILAQPITITISCLMPERILDGTEECTWTVGLENPNDENVVPTVINGMIHFNITNHSGNALPFTGGVGTALFTIGGVFIMIIALTVAFWTNKRKTTKGK